MVGSVDVKKTLFASLLVVAALSGAAAEPVGLVLSGGGAKGAYEVGVWKALCEAGVADRITVFSGTSVGAINAALLASVRDPDKCAQIWREEVGGAFVCNTNAVRDAVQSTLNDLDTMIREVKKDKKPDEELTQGDWIKICSLVATSAILKLGKQGNEAMSGASNTVGVCDSSRLRDALRRTLPERWSARSPVVYATAVAKARGAARSFKLNGNARERVIDCVMASAAIPGVFESVEIDGVAYVDGGYEQRGGDNAPLKPVCENHPEVKTVIVVYLNGEERIKRRVASALFPDVKIVEIIPSQDIGGRFLGLQGVVDCSPEKVESLISLGYSDAKRVLKENSETLGIKK